MRERDSTINVKDGRCEVLALWREMSGDFLGIVDLFVRGFGVLEWKTDILSGVRLSSHA